MKQEIGFCTASDGVRIAYARVGTGRPLVKAANWLNHLEYDWQSPLWRHWLRELARDHELIRYDERGNGLSDWDVSEISFEAFVRDLEAVVDTLELEGFVLLGISQGCAVSVEYAVRHPERVSQLVLYGGYARGLFHRDAAQRESAEAVLTLMRHGWGQENPAFRQIFTSSFIPGGTPEQMQWFNDLQRITTSPENAVRIRKACNDIDVKELLPRVQVPTLVLHCRNDAVAPFDEGRELAASIPGARFVPLESQNHLLLADEPAWGKFLAEFRSFLGVRGDRWMEVDRLFAAALEQPRDQRGRWLEVACADDAELRKEVSRLLELSEGEDDELRSGGAMRGPLGDEVARDLERLSVGERVGNYEITGILGSGGMGTVYRGQHPTLGREVAIKAVAQSFTSGPGLRRFEREAKLLASLNHPNVALVYDFLVSGDRPYLILELIEGQSLEDRLSRGALHIGEAIRIALQLAEAIQEAHEKGIVHRDLKPANIKINPEGRVKVLDFGLAKLAAPDVDHHAETRVRTGTALTQTGIVLGTPGYMSPEQARGEPVDGRTDTWAFGCIFYEMLTGEKAFRGNSASEAIASILRDEIDWDRLPSSSPPGLRRLLRRCLMKDPGDRLQDIGDARIELAKLSRKTRESSHPFRLPKWLRR